MNQRLTDIRRAQLDQLLSGGTNMAGGGLLKSVAKAAKPAAKAVTKVVEAAPQAEALRLAQQRAKSVGQSKDPRTRMLQQGYDDSWYHGTTGDIFRFRPDLLGETTGAQSAKKGFFFARDPLNPPESMLKKSNDPAAEDLLRKMGIPEEDIAKLNTVSMEGHGPDTASGYALIGGSREYKEAMRKAKAAERRGDWPEYEKQMQIAENSETTRMQYGQNVIAKYGDARDKMLEDIKNVWYGSQNSERFKNMSQADYEAYDKKFKELMPYGWYNSYSNSQLEGLKKELFDTVGEKNAEKVLNKINKFQSARNERALIEKTQEGGNVMPVALRYENPMVYDFEGKPYRDQSYSDLVDQALTAGNDALILKNTYDPGGGPSRLIDVGVVFEPDQIRSRFAAFDPLRKTAATAAAAGLAAPDLLAKEQDKAQGGLVHLAGGGDPRKRGLFPKMSTQAIVDSPGFDPEVPSDLSRAYARRMAEKDAYGRSMADQKLTPAQRAVAGAEATGMIGSALFEGVQQLPKLLDGEEAYTKAVGEGMYQPRFQPEKAAEYAGNVGDFLEKLETEYKMPALTPELMPFIGAAEAAKQQSKRAVKQGALTAASRMDAGPTAGSMAAQRGVVKMPGGNWRSNSVESQLKDLKSKGSTEADREWLINHAKQNPVVAQMGLDSIPKNEAINKWVESNLTNYVKKQMATPDDPVRKLAEQGIVHMPNRNTAAWNYEVSRKRAGYPIEGFGVSPEAKSWEQLADSLVYTDKAKSLIDPDQITDLVPHLRDDQAYLNLQQNPWLSKVDPEANIYSLGGSGLGFDHIVDVLKQDLAEGRIRPEQMNKVSMEQAVRRTYEYDQEMAKKMRETQAKVTEGMPVHKEYPEGYKWVELALPETPIGLPEGWTLAPNSSTEKAGLIQAMSPDGVRVLGRDMPDLVKNVYRRHPDTPGNPRQQLEQALKYEGDTMGHCVGGYCPDVIEGRSRIYSLRDAKGEPHVTVEVQPYGAYNQDTLFRQLIDKLGRDPTMEEFQSAAAEAPSRIKQIKGKGNRAPKEEYLPFVQDFVKGGNWSGVGDFHNTGLIRKSDLIDKFSSDELDAIGSGEYLTKAEHDDLLLKALRPPPAEGMAGGGSVGLKNALNNLLRTDKPEVHMGVGGAAAKAALKAAEAAKVAKAAYSPKVLNSTIDKFVAKIAAENPKLSEEDVLKKATRQATSKLEWERVQKPELEKTYGPLVKTPYSKTNVNKMQNTAEVVTERKRKANEFLDQPTEPWTPPAPELQAFDRSSIKDALEGFPGVDQTAFPRDIPTRASTSHVDELYADPENRALIEKQIKRGLPLGGETFYASLYPVKQAVLEAGMPAEKFDRWIHSLAPASARNSIMNEMASGQFLRDMNARGIPLTEENVAREMAVYKEKFGIGLPLMPLHREGVAKVIEGGQDLREMSKANIPTNYKIPTYGSQKAGDFANSVVLDVHEAGGQTQGSRFHPYFNEQGGFGNTEYNAGEQGLLGIAGDLGIPGGMAQAGRWFGGGELTGLRSPRGDALDLLEKQVAYTLSKKGIQPNPANVRAEVLRQIETGEGDLLPWYRKEGMPDLRQTGLQRKEGGEVTMEGGLTHCKTKKVKRHGNTVPH